jgi:predicted permease
MTESIIFGLRLLRLKPGYALVAVATMALGVGAATTLFSVANGVLLRPLPWADSDRLVQLTEIRGGRQGRIPGTILNGTYHAWSESPQTIESLGAWRDDYKVTLSGHGDPARITASLMTPATLTTLKAAPLMGRAFEAAEGAPGRQGVALISYAFWQRHFGGAADIIGRAIVIDGRSVEIVGVMARSFRFPSGATELWLPWALPPVEGEKGMKFGVIMRAFARMRPGVTVEQVSAEGTARASAAPDAGPMAMALFGARAPIQIVARNAHDAATAEVRPAIVILFAAAALLFVTAVANVANLQLARSAERHRELTIRAALGAGQARLARQLLVENGILASIGGAAGLVFSAVLHAALPTLLPPAFPRADAIAIDARVLAFSVALIAIATVACGLFPVLHARRLDLNRAIGESGTTGGGSSKPMVLTRMLIVSSQIAVTCVLLVGGTLLARSFVAYMTADRGYDPENVLTAAIPFLPSYTVERRTQILNGVVERLQSRPGVIHAAASAALPLASSGGFTSFTFDSPFRPGTQVDVETIRRVVTPSYFGALGLRVVAGRPLLDTDTAAAPTVVVVNRSFVRRYLDNVSPERALTQSLGTRAVRGATSTIAAGASQPAPTTIVGVVDDVKQDAPDGAAQPEMFVAHAQLPGVNLGAEAFVILRTAGDPTSYVDTLSMLVREQDPALAVDSVMTMEQRVGASLSRPRTYAVLLGGFSMFALLIAATGLFGVLSHTIAQRSRELAVRAALGATRIEVVRTALAQMTVAMIGGLIVGIAAALALSSSVETFLYGVSTRDAVSFALAPAALVVVSVLACIVPARRVARTDPATVLRQVT